MVRQSQLVVMAVAAEVQVPCKLAPSRVPHASPALARHPTHGWSWQVGVAVRASLVMVGQVVLGLQSHAMQEGPQSPL